MLKYILFPIFIALGILLSNNAPAQNTAIQYTHTIQEGDLVFVHRPCGPLCDAIIAVTQYRYAPYSHMGIVTITQGDTFVIEAISAGVSITPWLDFKSQYTYIDIGRIQGADTQLLPAVLEFCKAQLGAPYDVYFLMDNDKYYCSELIYDAFLAANKGIPFFDLAPMTYKDISTDQINTHWKAYFDALKVPVPEGILGCNPGGISLSNKLYFARLAR